MGSRIKCIVLALCLLAGTTVCYSQTYAEFFRQKKTQEKYLLKQLAYLKLYAGQLKKGYDVVSGGLGTIKDFTSGEFSLHEAFISGLSKVGPVVRKDNRIASIISLQLTIAKGFREVLNRAGLERENKAYVVSVREAVMVECNAELDELVDIVLSGKLEMTDSERLARLEKVYASMRDKADFASHFCSEVMAAVENSKAELIDLESIRRFYEKN